MKDFEKWLNDRLAMIGQAMEVDDKLKPIEQIKEIQNAQKMLILFKLDK